MWMLTGKLSLKGCVSLTCTASTIVLAVVNIHAAANAEFEVDSPSNVCVILRLMVWFMSSHSCRACVKAYMLKSIRLRYSRLASVLVFSRERSAEQWCHSEAGNETGFAAGTFFWWRVDRSATTGCSLIL